jgi:PAS domain S-box-containing protein
MADLSIPPAPQKSNEISDPFPLQGGMFLDTVFQLPIKDLLFHTNAGLLVTNARHELMWINDILLKQSALIPDVSILLGRPVANVIQYMQEFVVRPRIFRKRIAELAENKKTYYGEEIPLIDGRIIGLDYIPLYHEDQFYGAIWQLTDYSNRIKGLKKYEVQTGGNPLSELMDQFHIVFCEIDTAGDIINFSPYFCRFTGYPEEELRKTNFLDLCLSGKPQMLNCIKNHRAGILKRTSCTFELEILLRNGLRKWMQCHVSPKEGSHGEIKGGMLLLTEITEQKHIQQELEDAKRIAEQAQLAQQQFLANMSHDIRTPLNAIIGMTFLLEDTPLNEEQGEYVKVLKNASNILLGLLNGVLDFAKIASGKQEIRQREFDLPRLLQSLVETFSFKLNDKPVRLRYYIDPDMDQVLLGDDILLNQILMNLLSNAEKFTAKGEINLRAAISKEYENNIWIEFQVEDTGIGISTEKLMAIFQDFTQADDEIRINYGGSGLGLFICKKLVEMLGGKISVESLPGRGTTFVFSIPFGITGQSLKKQENPIGSRHAFHTVDARILVVEDNQMNLKYLSSLLNKYGIYFDVATDGKMALKKAKDHYYNLILMDMKLPKMSGLDVAAYIREKETLNVATPIVLVSAAAFQSTVDKAREVGVNELLAKPYTPEQLVNILKKYLVEEEMESNEDVAMQDAEDFKFDERLDVEYLNKLYAGNCAYAMSLFEVFLECMESDWEEIDHSLSREDWVALKNLVHKVKPNFSMVGLTWLTRMMQELYDRLKQEDYSSVPATFQLVRQEYDRFMPVVKDEYRRMQQFIGQEVS